MSDGKFEYIMKFIRKISLIFLFSLCVLPMSASNLLYGPWVCNVTENGFTVLWVTEKPSLDYVEIAPPMDHLLMDSIVKNSIRQVTEGGRQEPITVSELTL